MGLIGEPEEYIVTLEDTASVFASASVDASTVLHELPWASGTRWGRVKNGVSTATVFISNDEWGRTRCPYPLHGWDDSIGIYRNGTLVWRGPLLGWRRTSAGQIELSAQDIGAFMDRALSLEDQTATDVSLWSFVDTYVDNVGLTMHASAPYTFMTPYLFNPGESGGVLVTKSLVGKEARTMSTVFGELSTEFDLFYAVGPDGFHFDPAEYNFGASAPTLHEGSVAGMPQVAVDCSNVAGAVFAVGSNAGTGGYQVITDSSMGARVGATAYSSQPLAIIVEPNVHLQGDQFDVAVTKPSANALSPKVTVETLRLLPSFGSVSATAGSRCFNGIDDLRPGLVVRWGFDADCLSAIPITTVGDVTTKIAYVQSERLAAARLVQLDVTIGRADGGIIEAVNGSFIPIADAAFSSVIAPEAVGGGGYIFPPTGEP